MRAARLACTILMAAVASVAAASHVTAAEPMSYGQFKALTQPEAKLRIPYGTGPSQFGELWLPEGEGPFPTVVMIHGGCWTASVAGLGIMNLAAQDLAKRGIAVWNIEYRRLGEPGGGYPGTFQDVAAAVDHLRVLAPKHGLKLDRVVAVGHSAGGHLGLWAAARARLPRSSPLHAANPVAIASVVSVGGLADLEVLQATGAHGCGPEPFASLTGKPTPERPDVFADTSPAALLPFGARQVSIHGRLDRIAPLAAGEGYAYKARAYGDPVELVAIPGAGHFELITPGAPAWDRAAALIETLAN